MNSFQDMFDRQKRYSAAGVTRSHAWRIEQLATFAVVENGRLQFNRPARLFHGDWATPWGSLPVFSFYFLALDAIWRSNSSFRTTAIL